MNLLTLAGMADAALNDATDAHLIMIALRQSEPSATWPPAWLEQWAARRQIQDAALAVWTGLNGGTLSATATPDLSRFAERHGLSFISDDGVPAGNESAVVPRSLHEPHGGSDPALAHVLEQPLDDSYQHWGLNE